MTDEERQQLGGLAASDSYDYLAPGTEVAETVRKNPRFVAPPPLAAATTLPVISPQGFRGGSASLDVPAMGGILSPRAAYQYTAPSAPRNWGAGLTYKRSF